MKFPLIDLIGYSERIKQLRLIPLGVRVLHLLNFYLRIVSQKGGRTGPVIELTVESLRIVSHRLDA